MSFSETLRTLVERIEGCEVALIVGIDGLLIERYLGDIDPSLDLDIISTELTTLLRRSQHTAADIELGNLLELVFTTDRQTFLLRPITTEYFLLLGLHPGGNVGRARYELRKAQLELESEFAI